MYYASMTEDRLKQESKLEVYKITDKKRTKSLYNTLNELEQDSLLTTFKKLDLRLIVEGYNNKDEVIFKVGLDKCGNYQIGNMFYLVNKNFKTVLEEFIPNLQFLECSFAK